MSNDEKVYVRPKITRHILVEYHISQGITRPDMYKARIADM